MASMTPQYKVFRLPLTPYVAWAREHPNMDQPTDERQYPSYPSHTPANIMMRFCIRDRKWKPKSDFPQDPARPGHILLSKRGQPIKFCTRCNDYINQRVLEKKGRAVRKKADRPSLRRKGKLGGGAARLLHRRLEENLRRGRRLDREVEENRKERRLLLGEMERLEGARELPEEEDDDREVRGGGRGRDHHDDEEEEEDEDEDNDEDDEYTSLPNIHENNRYHTREQTHAEYFNPSLAIAAATATHQTSYPNNPTNTNTYTYTYPAPPTNDQPTPYPSSYDSYPDEPYGAYPYPYPHDPRHHPTMLSFEHGTYRPLTPAAPRLALQNRRHHVLGSSGINGTRHPDEGPDGREIREDPEARFRERMG